VLWFKIFVLGVTFFKEIYICVVVVIHSKQHMKENKRQPQFDCHFTSKLVPTFFNIHQSPFIGGSVLFCSVLILH